LQGNIEDFSISEIFRLVSSHRKSGSLNISSNGCATDFFFFEGRIIDAHPIRPVRESHSLLGIMLRDAGYITDSELRRVLELMEKGKRKKIGDILVEQGMAPRDIVSKYLILQIKECLFNILAFKDGQYRFERLTARPVSFGGELVRPDVLIVEMMRFMDEYPELRRKFPAGDFRVLRKREEHVDPNFFSDQERVLWNALAYSEEQALVFRKACMTVFEGIRLLSALHDHGLVEIESAAKPDEDAVRQVREKMLLLKRQAGIRAALWAGALVVVLLWAMKLFLSPEASRFFTAWMGFL